MVGQAGFVDTYGEDEEYGVGKFHEKFGQVIVRTSTLESRVGFLAHTMHKSESFLVPTLEVIIDYDDSYKVK